MMNKLKNLFLLAICALAFAGAAPDVSAQTGANEVLVAGKQPLRQSDVRQLIDFYEWAFETVFSPDEYINFKTLTIEAYRQDPATSRKNADALISALPKVKGKNPTEQSEVRRAFNEAFVKDLRAGTDEASQLLLGIYERSQRRDSKGIGNGNGDGGEKIVEVLPSEEDMRDAEQSPSNVASGGSSRLVGTWFRSDGTGGATDGTGKTRYNSGTDTTFEFFADGKMRVTIKQETLSITQCHINETTKLPGTYSVSGDRLTMNFSAGTVVGTNSCQSSGNFKKTLTASTMTKTFVVKNLESVFRPDAPRILCLDGSADNACFEKTIR